MRSYSRLGFSDVFAVYSGMALTERITLRDHYNDHYSGHYNGM
jgi:hypothetical protein